VISDQHAYYETHALNTTDFSSPTHGQIWQVASDLAEKSALSTQSLVEGLRDANILDSVGDGVNNGEDYIRYLETKADGIAFPEAVQTVIDDSDKRHIGKIAQALYANTKNGHRPDEIIDEHMAELLQVRRTRTREPVLVGKAMLDLKEETEKKRLGLVKPRWEFPILAFHKKIPGLLDADFIVVVAPTGSGKSSFIRNVAWQTAKKGKNVLTFNYENTAFECMTWAIAQETGIDHKHIIWPHLASNWEYEKIQNAWSKLEGVPWKIIEMAGDPINTIRRMARVELMKGRLDLIQVDGAYLIGGKKDSAYDLIGSNMQGLRSLAQELHVPIMATTQFNRGGSAKDDPDETDLLYAGENPARIIAAIRKKDMTDNEIRMFDENIGEDNKLLRGKATKTVIVRGKVVKQTNGETGDTIDMSWTKYNQRFNTLVADWEPPQPVQTEMTV